MMSEPYLQRKKRTKGPMSSLNTGNYYDDYGDNDDSYALLGSQDKFAQNVKYRLRTSKSLAGERSVSPPKQPKLHSKRVVSAKENVEPNPSRVPLVDADRYRDRLSTPLARRQPKEWIAEDIQRERDLVIRPRKSRSLERMEIQKRSDKHRRAKTAERKGRYQNWEDLAHGDVLQEASPELEAAKKALVSINKKDIQELKSFSKPPQMVKDIMDAVLIIFGIQPTWANAKKLLGDFDFMNKLVNFKVENIPKNALKKLGQFLADRPDLKPECAEKVAATVKGLCLFVRAVDVYRQVQQAVDSRKRKLKEARSKITENEAGQSESVCRKKKEKESDSRHMETDCISKYGHGLSAPHPRRKRLSEYQKQFQWRRGDKSLPLLDAQQVVYRSDPQLSAPRVDEVPALSEYRQQFKEYEVAVSRKERDVTVTEEQNASKEVPKVEVQKKRRVGRDIARFQDMVDRRQKDLAAVLPAQEKAIKALDCLSKGDIVEIKSLACPPVGVKLVMEAVLILLGKKQPTWKDCKKELGDASFLKRLCNYDKDNIPDHILKKVGEYLTRPEFDSDRIRNVSRAAAGLCQWVRAMEEYGNIYKVIKPRKVALKDAELRLKILEDTIIEPVHDRAEMKKLTVAEDKPDRKYNLRDSPSSLLPKASKGHPRKFRSEYRSNFAAPQSFVYDDGTWRGARPPHVRASVPEETMGQSGKVTTNWYSEVLELRQRAQEYRMRAQGTHFSREHLVQLLGNQTDLWDMSTARSSGTVSALSLESGQRVQPQKRPERSGNGTSAVDVMTEKEQQSKKDEMVPGSRRRKQAWSQEESPDRESPDSEDYVLREEGGRLDTPHLMYMEGNERKPRRHHLDMTTPAVGGALLTSPPPPKYETRKASKTTKRGIPVVSKSWAGLDMENDLQVEDDISSEEEEQESKPLSGQKTYTINKGSLGAVPTYGMPSHDSHVLRDDDASGDRPLCTQYVHSPQKSQAIGRSSGQTPQRKHGPKPSLLDTINENYGQTYSVNKPTATQPHMSWTIDGGLPVVRKDEDDDYVQSLSTRSLASSCSLASEVLERARKRKEEFWQKRGIETR